MQKLTFLKMCGIRKSIQYNFTQQKNKDHSMDSAKDLFAIASLQKYQSENIQISIGFIFICIIKMLHKARLRVTNVLFSVGNTIFIIIIITLML